MTRTLAWILAAASLAAAQEGTASTRPTREQQLARARALVDQGNVREAAPLVLAALGLEPPAAPALAVAAKGFAEAGDRRTARALLGVAVHLDPSRTDLLAVRGALALEDGSPHEALRDAEGVLAKAQADVEARVLRARALHAAGRRAEARDALAALDRAAPLEAALVRVLAALDLEQGLVGEAEARLRRLGPLEAADAALLARAWLDAGGPRRAIAAIEGVAGAETRPELARLAAAAHVETGDPSRARALLLAIAGPAADDLVAIAHAERLSGDLAGAAERLAAALARDPGMHAARAELVRVRVAQGDLAAARRLLFGGLELAPLHPAFARLLEDLVPELAPTDGATLTAALAGGVLTVEGETIEEDPAPALARLRALRLAAGTRAPKVTLVLEGPLDAAAVRRAFDLLAAAGFSRIAIASR